MMIEKSHYLFIKLDSYGDLILLEPMLRMMKKNRPELIISVLIQAKYADICSLFNEDINWITTNVDPYVGDYDSQQAAIDLLKEQLTAMTIESFVSVCVNKTWVDYLLKAWFPNRRWASMQSRSCENHGIRAPLLGHVEVPDDLGETVTVEESLHEVYKNLTMAAYLIGKEEKKERPCLHVTSGMQQHAQKLLAELRLEEGSYIVMACAGHANVQIKQWHATGFAKVAGMLMQRKFRVLLVGHESERESILKVKQLCADHQLSCAVWLGTSGSFSVLAALLDKSAGYVGNDSGPLHLACALDKPVVGIYGGGTWPRFLPQCAVGAAVVYPLACFGCGWQCSWGQSFCIQAITADAVCNAVELVWGNSPPEGLHVVEQPAIGACAEQRTFIALVADHVKSEKFHKTELSSQVVSLSRQVAVWKVLYDDLEKRYNTILQGHEKGMAGRIKGLLNRMKGHA